MLRQTGRAQTDRNMPQVSGQLRFARELRDKISRGVRDFKGLNHPVCYSDRAKEVVERYKVIYTFTLSVRNKDIVVCTGVGLPDHLL